MMKDIMLKNKYDYETTLKFIINPIQDLFDEKKSIILLDEYFAAQYSDKVMGIETFARLLWGIAPYSVGKKSELIEKIIKMIINGTNPSENEYWGDIKDYDQKIVEMTPIIMFCYYNIDQIRNIASEEELKNIEDWFYSINSKKVSKNNWLFFKILVNLFLKKCNMKYSIEVIEKSFEDIEKMYLGDGWYSDGISRQRDYYVSFAIHYYSLLYLKYSELQDEKSKIIKERAILFSKEFIYWFADDGSAIPFGRSLTYKFAQIAFWSAMILNKIYPISIEEIKGIINRNLRWWFKQDIFDKQGNLQVGYCYKNTLFTENYNASGSSYWALKSFIFLALDSNDEFYKCEEHKMPILDNHVFQKHSFMNICRDGSQVVSFPNGQYCENEFAHTECKYEKFSYSTLSGFNVSKSNTGISNCSCDSTISVSHDGKHFFSRTNSKVIRNCKEYMHSIWEPWDSVKIETILIPKLPMHIRIHKIESEKEFYFYDGGFAIDNTNIENKIINKGNFLSIVNNQHVVGVISILGNGVPDVINSAPNTNILYKRSDVPVLKWKLKKGKYIIINGIYTAKNGEYDLAKELEKIPKIEVKDDLITIGDISLNIYDSYKVPSKHNLIMSKLKKFVKGI